MIPQAHSPPYKNQRARPGARGSLLFALLLSLTALTARQAGACALDMDCRYGARCLKASDFELYGICYGGFHPGNDNDTQPVHNWQDSSDKLGNTCKFDSQCWSAGTDRKCRKDDTSLTGVCL